MFVINFAGEGDSSSLSMYKRKAVTNHPICVVLPKVTKASKVQDVNGETANSYANKL